MRRVVVTGLGLVTPLGADVETCWSNILAGRSGFAHLHPMEADVSVAPDAVKPTLSFKITIPTAGRYVIWAQVKLDGRETFVPFWFDVAP